MTLHLSGAVTPHNKYVKCSNLYVVDMSVHGDDLTHEYGCKFKGFYCIRKSASLLCPKLFGTFITADDRGFVGRNHQIS